MQEFLWKLSAFDPNYVSVCTTKTRTVFILTGLVVLLLVLCSIGSFFFVGYVVSNSLIEGVLAAALFSSIQLNFYRMSLLTVTWHSHNTDISQKPHPSGVALKLILMTLNLLFFIFCFELMLFHQKIEAIIAQDSTLSNGIITRMNLLTTQIPFIGLLTFLLWVFFSWPLLARFFVASYGSEEYDKLKATDETGRIKNSFDQFLVEYKQTLTETSQGAAEDFIYDLMVDAPFNKKLVGNKFIIVKEEKLFAFLDEEPNNTKTL